MKILYEDGEIIVCVKPQGIISQSNGENDMVSILNEHFAGSAQAYPIHRLDKETGGVMVFAKNPKAAAALSKQAQQNRIKKRYYAVVHGCPAEKSGILEDLLFRDKQKNKTYVVKRERKGVRPASLEYTFVDECNGLSLLNILLHTGRTHQIRVQFSSRKMPLYGDGKYGGGAGKLALFAYSLEFFHPTSNEKLSFFAEPDINSTPWNNFVFSLKSSFEEAKSSV